MQTLSLPEVLFWLGLVVLGTTTVVAVARAMRPRQQPALVDQRPIQIRLPTIRPCEDAERLVDCLARGVERGRVHLGVAIMAGDVTCSARWEIDLSAHRLGIFRVQIGAYVGYATDLDQVYALTRDRLEAIVEERGGLRVAGGVR
jgi:hypothetical protein